MPARLTELIDKQDAFEVMRDRLAEILLLETTAQQALALAAARDPADWAFRVFTETSNPWEAWSADVPTADFTPIVNVSVDTMSFDQRGSNKVSRQKSRPVFHIDCFAGAVAEATPEGHAPSDTASSLKVQRVVRLVRNILMSGFYVYPGTTREEGWDRWITSVAMLDVPSDALPVVKVAAARLTYEISVNETSPQASGEPLEAITTTIKREKTGEVYLVAEFDHTPETP